METNFGVSGPVAQHQADQRTLVPPTAAALAQSMERAYVLAQRQGHGLVTPEHLLFALTEDQDALRLFDASRTDVPRLQAEVLSYLTRVHEDLARALAALPDGPRPSTDMLMILQTAARTAQGTGKPVIDGALVVTALVADGRSAAAGILYSLGLGFDRAVEPPQGRNQAPVAAQLSSQPTVRTAPPQTEQALAVARQRLRDQGFEPTGTIADTVKRSAFDSSRMPRAQAPIALPRASTAAQSPRPTLLERGHGGERALEGRAPATYAPREPYFPQQPSVPSANWDQPTNWVQPGPPGLVNGVEFQTLAAQQPQAFPSHRFEVPPPMLPTLPGAPQDALAFEMPAGAPYLPAYDVPVYAPEPYVPIASRAKAVDEFSPIPLPVQPSAQLDISQLIRTMPRKLKRGKIETFELNIPREELARMAPGAFDDAYPLNPDIFATRAIAARLTAPAAAITIEPQSAETVWIDPHSGSGRGRIDDEFLTWRWRLIGRERGNHKVQILVSVRLIGPDGLAADQPFPIQTLDVAVVQNPARVAVRVAIGCALIAAGTLAGLVVSGKFGSPMGLLG